MKAKNKNSNQDPLYQSSLYIGDTEEQKSEDGSQALQIEHISNDILSLAQELKRETHSYMNKQLSQRYLEPNLTSQPDLAQYPGTAINFVTTILFLGIFGYFMYLLKKHLAKFIAFYILKQDYQRLRCMENEEDPFVDLDAEVGLQEEQLNKGPEEYSPQKLPRYTTPEKIQQSPGVEPPLNSRAQTPIAISRSMTRGEIIQEYKRTFLANLKIYHPVISSITTKFTNAELNKHLSLPKRVCYVLSLSWILHTLTFSFAFQDLGQKFADSSLCKDSRSSIILFICHSQNPSYNSNGSVSLLISIISAIVATILVFFLTRNYFEFLEFNKRPLTVVEILQEESQGNSLVNKKQESRQNDMKYGQDGSIVGRKNHKRTASNDSTNNPKRSKKFNFHDSGQPTTQIEEHTTQQQLQKDARGLYPIQEDDEEQPFSPSIHKDGENQNDQDESEMEDDYIQDEDDIGDDEMISGKPNNARGAVINNQNTLGIKRSKALSKRFKSSASQKSVLMKNSPTNKSGSFIKDDRHEDCERCRIKNSKVRVCDHYKSGILQSNPSQLSLRELNPGMPSKIDINDSNRINLFPAPLQNNGSHKTLTERYGGSSTSDGITPAAGPMGGETELELLKFMSAANGNQNFSAKKDGDMGFSPKLEKIQNRQDSAVVVLTPEMRLQKCLKFTKIGYVGIYYLCQSMCPIYILNQLSTLSQSALSAVLLSFLYALLFDCFLIRPLSIFFGSLLQAKQKLQGQYYLTESNSEEVNKKNLQINELQLLGDFYETYECPILTAIDCDSTFEEQQPYQFETGPVLKSEEEAIIGSEREAMSGTRALILTNGGKKQAQLVKKVVRRKLPTQCPRFIMHETAHIQSVYIKTSTLVEEDDGVAPDTESRLAAQERYNDEEAIPTENGGVFSSTSRLMSNQAQVIPIEGSDQEAARNSPDKKLISKPYITTQNANETPIKIIKVNPLQQPQSTANHKEDISVIDADPRFRSGTQQRLGHSPTYHDHDQDTDQNFETPPLSPNTNGQSPDQAKNSKRSVARNLAATTYSKEEIVTKKSSAGSKKLIAKIQKENVEKKGKSGKKGKKAKEIDSKMKQEMMHLNENSLGENSLEMPQHQYVTDQKQRPIQEQGSHDQEFKSPNQQQILKNKKGQQFSPKYSSFGKTTSRQNDEEEAKVPAIDQNKSSQQPPVLLNIRDDEVASKKQTFINIRNSILGEADLRGSLMGSKNSLLKSVLNQNRDKEPIENNCDFTEILKPSHPIISNVSPKQLNSSVEIIGDRASKKFNSPRSLAKEQHLLHQSSSHSKKKKYSSIIVQPEAGHHASFQHTQKAQLNPQSSAYDELRFNDEEDIIIKQVDEFRRQPSDLRLSKVEQQLSQLSYRRTEDHPISIILSQNDKKTSSINDQLLKYQQQATDSVGNRTNDADTFQPQNNNKQSLIRLNTNSSSSNNNSPRDVQTQEVEEEVYTKKSKRSNSREQSNRSQSKSKRSSRKNSPKKTAIPQSRLIRQRGLMDKGTVSSKLEPISEDKDEVLKSYSKLNFQDIKQQQRGRSNNAENNGLQWREKNEGNIRSSSSATPIGATVQIKAKQRDLLEKLGKRIATKSKKTMQTEVVEEEIPGHTLENWTQDMNPDTQSPNPLKKRHHPQDDDDDEPKIQLQGMDDGNDDEEQTRYVVRLKNQGNHRGTGSVGSKPSIATVKQLQQSQYGKSDIIRTEEDDRGQLMKSRILKQSTSSASSYQIITSADRLGRQQ